MFWIEIYNQSKSHSLHIECRYRKGKLILGSDAPIELVCYEGESGSSRFMIGMIRFTDTVVSFDYLANAREKTKFPEKTFSGLQWTLCSAASDQPGSQCTRQLLQLSFLGTNNPLDHDSAIERQGMRVAISYPKPKCTLSGLGLYGLFGLPPSLTEEQYLWAMNHGSRR